MISASLNRGKTYSLLVETMNFRQLNIATILCAFTLVSTCPAMPGDRPVSADTATRPRDRELFLNIAKIIGYGGLALYAGYPVMSASDHGEEPSDMEYGIALLKMTPPAILMLYHAYKQYQLETRARHPTLPH